MEVIGLIAGISGEILTKKLHKKKVHVAIVAGHPNEPGTDIADYICITDLSNKEEIAEFFMRRNVKNVIIGTGHILAFNVAQYLEKKGMVLSIDVKASFLAKNKIRYKERLRMEGINTPKEFIVEGKKINLNEVVKQVGLPCVIKSPEDKYQPICVKDAMQLQDGIYWAVERDSSVLIEEFIDGINVTVPVLVDKRRRCAKAILLSYYNKAREYNLKGFGFMFHDYSEVDFETEESIKKYCENVAIRTDMDGLCRVDAIITKEKKIYVLETNSVMVTAAHNNQVVGFIDYEEGKYDFADILVENSLKKFLEGQEL